MGSLGATSTIPKPRIPFAAPVWMSTHGHLHPASLYASNLSETGIFLQTTDAPQIGTKLSLKFYLDNSDQAVEAVAEVIWVKRFEPINIDGVLPGMGAHFLSFESNAQEMLCNYIQQKLPASQNHQGVEASMAAHSNTSSAFNLEMPMALQVKGEMETTFGYTTAIDAHGIEFNADHISPRSMIDRLKRGKILQSVKGCVAVPVEITPGKSARSLTLKFLELRADLLAHIRTLTGQTLSKSHTHPKIAAERLQQLSWWQKPAAKSRVMALLITTLALIGLGSFVAGYFASRLH